MSIKHYTVNMNNVSESAVGLTLVQTSSVHAMVTALVKIQQLSQFILVCADMVLI